MTPRRVAPAPFAPAPLVLALALLVAACGEEEAAAPPPVRPVLSMVVGPGHGEAPRFAGVVEPRYESALGFRVLGRVVDRTVEVGDRVAAGAPLASIDPLPFALEVRAAEADVASAEAQLENATATEERQRALLAEDAASQSQVEAAQQAREAAAAALTQARAALDQARERLGYATLRADFDGVVTEVGAEVGQVVEAGRMVVTVARPDVREAVIDLPEVIAAALDRGGAVEVALTLDPAVRTAGAVREIAPQADPVTRTRRVWITLEEPPDAFRLGSTVTARLPAPAQAAAGLMVPRTAVLERDGRTWVWVVDPERRRVALREVRLAEAGGGGGAGGGVARVADGLDAGARVVTAGVHSLEPDQEVRIVDEATR